jgi:hypothetical protein
MFKDDSMAVHLRRSVLIGSIISCLSGPVVAQDEDDEPDLVILGIALADAPMSLAKGLEASEPSGKPISAKFENADGDVQLSIYTATADGFIETTINPKSGAVVSTEPITDADDLTHANAQQAAMAKATVSLQAAAEKAVNEKPDSRAVSVVPELRDGRPIAVVKLLRTKDVVTAMEPLN